MNIKDIDLVKLTKLTSQQVDYITCLECCKYYIAPETAACGHTLCHSCWHGRRTCPSCTKPLERSNLRPNLPIQYHTEHVLALGEAFENLFKIKIDDFLLDTDEMESENDPTKNVKDWLGSSQNHFSAPAVNSEQSPQEIQQPNLLNVSSNKIQIHTNTLKTKSREKVVHVPTNVQSQDDWDKIEPMPDTEDIEKSKENVVGPMDIEPFNYDDNEYTISNPRRSFRKRLLKPTDVNAKMNENNTLEKQSSKDSSGEIDKNTNKTKQTWNNVKRMRKEFSKLNKKNRNKLNVSIEMCKKTQSTAKTNVELLQAPSSQVYDIDENTPDNFNFERQKEIPREHSNDVEDKHSNNISISNTNNKNECCKAAQQLNNIENPNNNLGKNNDNQETNADSVQSLKHIELNRHVTEKAVKIPFYKKNSLCPKHIEANNQTTNHNVDLNNTISDDLEITIKLGNTIANITIIKKNDIKVKDNENREIQTSLMPHDVCEKSNVVALQNTNIRNIKINFGDNPYIDLDHQTNSKVEEFKKVTGSLKTVSEKKNTDSADTATAQFEITESVEKELSKVMECVEVNEQIKFKSPTAEKISQNNKLQKPAANQDDDEYLNDLDIFDSESVKETDVQLLKNTEHAPSEILLCTVKTKNKTQKHTEKRDRDANDETALPKPKKPKLKTDSGVAGNETIESSRSIQNKPESESMNYDSVMGTVFANIDADIEEIRQSQNGNTHSLTRSDTLKKINEHKRGKKALDNKDEDTQDVVIISGTNEIISPIKNNEYCTEKDSENIFSVCIDKENENVNAAEVNKQVLLNVLPSNIEEFLTPVMESTGEVLVINNDVEMLEDSDKSVVEETPQKTSSISKSKQKSNGNNKEVKKSEQIEVSKQKALSNKKSSESSNKKSIVNITDTSTGINSTDETVINTENKKSLETPLTHCKFVDQIQYKSTPYARKSLNFESQNMNDSDTEHTVCPTNDAIIARTTQEKEFMAKAFEKTPTTPAVRPLGLRNIGLKNKKIIIAGSCLTFAEIAKLKLLCTQHKWTYTDKYSKDLTHLVVSVDEENKSQRSVKYMCALASSIWIISYEWVEKCLQSKDIVSEEYFEVLDNTGEPGPRRSRVATKKLFQGITFLCMEPFSVLDVDNLKGILEAAGGKVVKKVEEVKVSDENSSPAILLAEPENTQEDRFIYLAMHSSIVPVNYEWVLNCLGRYTLDSIHELLLCPASFLPKATEKWPQELLARDED